jgi:hypothetical protein
MDRRLLVLIPISLLLTACDSDKPGSVVTPSPTPIASPSPTPTPGVATIPTTGGTVELPSIASLEAPSGAFSANTGVVIGQVAVADLGQDFTFNTGPFFATNPLAQAVTIILDRLEEPVGDVKVTLVLPASYVSTLPANSAFAIMAGTVNASPTEPEYDTYDIRSGTFDAATRKLTVTVNGAHFLQRTTEGKAIGRFVVVQVPGPQSAN